MYSPPETCREIRILRSLCRENVTAVDITVDWFFLCVVSKCNPRSRVRSIHRSVACVPLCTVYYTVTLRVILQPRFYCVSVQVEIKNTVLSKWSFVTVYSKAAVYKCKCFSLALLGYSHCINEK